MSSERDPAIREHSNLVVNEIRAAYRIGRLTAANCTQVLSRKAEQDAYQRGFDEAKEQLNEALGYIQHMVDHDHQLYCRKDGSACVATCVNGRAILATIRALERKS